MKKTICIILSLMLAAALSVSVFAAAAADAQLPALLSAARALLFETSNVTVSGHADFYYEGERFKTADILYKQDGYNSWWQLDLLTPRAYRPDRETGYTVVANGETFYYTERYNPGMYYTGSDAPSNTLVRQSARSDALLAVASASAGLIESLLPDGCVTVVSDSADGRELRIRFERGDSPDLLNATLSLAAEFALHRFMGFEFDYVHDAYRGHMEDYITVTQGILHTTRSFVLGDADVTVRTDALGRLSSVSGNLTALLSADDSSASDLTIIFNADITGYGTTAVKTFDPGSFQSAPSDSGAFARPLSEADPALTEKLVSRAKEVLAAAGNAADAPAEIWEDDGIYTVLFRSESAASSVSVSMNADGKLLSLADDRDEYYLQDPRQPTVASLPEDAAALMQSFLQQEAPDLLPLCREFVPGMEYDFGGTLYEFVTAFDENGGETDISFVVQLGTSPKIITASLISF